MDKSKITYAFPKKKDVDPSCYIDAYTLVLECSLAHSPRSFATRLLELLKKVCPYDEAMVFFFDANGKVSGCYTVNVKDEWVKEYMDIYLSTDAAPEEVSLYQNLSEDSDFNFSRIIDWGSFPKSDFITNYIDKRGLKYSWGFTFFDLNGAYRVVFALDRTRKEAFSEFERYRLELALPILNNMHRNFFYQGMDTKDHVVQSPWRDFKLTPRESEIANLLCQGMTVQKISSTLYIAVTTTYKHIAHIYEKLGVSSQQELLVKMLNKKAL